ncbi:ribonuclease HI family protein [Patescibacteria group bacterium]
MDKIIINTDGGSRGNPGPSAIGVVISDGKGKILKKYNQAIGKATNNEAEYHAVIFALEKAKLFFGKIKSKTIDIEMKLDSELVVKQINHQYRLKEDRIKDLFIKIWNLMIDFNSVNFTHIPREENKQADKLVNEALDDQSEEAKLF